MHILFDDAGRLQQKDERRRRAVHDGNFRAGEIDQHVVSKEKEILTV